MKITHGPSPAPTKMCSVSGGQCTKSHACERPLLALDKQQALTGEHEEVLLVRLAVVHAVGPARLEHRDREAELSGNADVGALEDARGAEGLVGHPRRVARR